jgi:hypothetical protein
VSMHGAGVDRECRGVKLDESQKPTAQQIQQARSLLWQRKRTEDIAVSFDVGRITLHRALATR